MVAALEAAAAQAAAASEVADKYALKGFAICQHALKGFAICQHALKYSVTEVSYVVQVRAEGPKAPSPGHRPGYNGDQQGAL